MLTLTLMRLYDYANSRQPFDKLKHRQIYKEIADVADGAYDWKINSVLNKSIKHKLIMIYYFLLTVINSLSLNDFPFLVFFEFVDKFLLPEIETLEIGLPEKYKALLL